MSLLQGQVSGKSSAPITIGAVVACNKNKNTTGPAKTSNMMQKAMESVTSCAPVTPPSLSPVPSGDPARMLEVVALWASNVL